MSDGINVEKLEEIKQNILANPKHFDMRDWYISDKVYRELFAPDTKEEMISCGTTACIAGWACIGTQTANDIDVCFKAREILHLDYRQANNLFYEYNWPARFQAFSDTSPEVRAKLAAKRIDHFIKTNGEE